MEQRLVRFLFVLLVPLSAITAHAHTTYVDAQTTDEELLTARLGGTRQSFESAFGSPAASHPGIGVQYDAPGYGLLAVQYQPQRRGEPGPTPEDRAVQITVRAERPADQPALSPDPADWTVAEAEQTARDLLPEDVEFAPEPIVADGSMAFECQSAALAQAFVGEGGLAELGGCRVSFVMPTDSTVSFVMLNLSAGSAIAPAGTPVDACAGMRDWAMEAASRMQTATMLLDEISQLDGDDPTAADQLRLAAARFALMAADQRGGDIPAAAAETNQLLTDAFTAYHAAIEQAATALEARAADQIDAAARLLEGANADLARADAVMLSALESCGISVEEGATTTEDQ